MKILLLSCLMVFTFKVASASGGDTAGGAGGGASNGSGLAAATSGGNPAAAASGSGGTASAADGDSHTVAVGPMHPLPDKVFGVVRSKSADGFALEKRPNASGTVTRLLSLDTGDSNGLGTAFMLAVLEEILKHPSNQRDEVTFHSIKETFHVFSGTSMGNLIATFLVHKHRSIPPMEIVRFFYRYLPFKVFSAEELKDNLLQLFGTDPVKDAFAKHVYLWGATDKRGICFTNSTLVDPLETQLRHKPENTPVPDALSGMVARGSISPFKIATNAGGHITIEDGTSYADAQALSSYEHNMEANQKIEIYSFGSGLNQAARSEVVRRNEESARTHLLRSLMHQTSPLAYFAQLQPQLGNSVGYDSVDSHAQRNCIEAALRSVRSDAFRDMVRQLGLVYPEADIGEICTSVSSGMKALSSKNLTSLSVFELEWLSRQIIALDYEILIQGKIFYYDGAVVKQMTPQEHDVFLASVAAFDKQKFGNSRLETNIRTAKALRESCQKLSKIDSKFWNLLKGLDSSQAQEHFRLLEGGKWGQYWESLKEAAAHCVDGATAVVAQAVTAVRPAKQADAFTAQPQQSSRNLAASAAAADDDGFEDVAPGPDELAPGFEDALLATQMTAQIDGNNFLIHFMQDYISFLNEKGYKDHNADGIEIASMLYLRARLGDEPFVDFEGLQKLASSVESVVKVIIQAKNPGLVPDWVTRFFSATRYSHLHRVIEQYVTIHFVQSVSMDD